MKLNYIAGFSKNSDNKKITKLAVLLVIFIVLLVTLIILVKSILNTPYVYTGVYLDGIHMGGMDKPSLIGYINSKYNKDFSSMIISVYHKDHPLKVSFRDLNISINRESIVDMVYSAGRQGNFIKRLIKIYNFKKKHLYLETEVNIDMEAINSLEDAIYAETYKPAVPPALVLLENEAYIRSGLRGQKVNKEKLRERMLEQVRKLESGIVIVPVDEIQPSRIDADSFYEKIVREPQDARIDIENGSIRITPEVIGRSLDKKDFLSYVAEVESKSGRYIFEMELPVNFIKPNTTKETIEKSLFRDILSSYETVFPTDTENDRSRSVNIRLAVEAINGTILLPGDSFSFNETVGKRTADKGYHLANIYTSDGIAAGVGGGVCQVSSTLYNAVLEANLKVTERSPHMYAVQYVPLGRDAAVSYGTEDLQFTNTANWPVKIEGTVTGGSKIRFTIHGTNEHPNLKVSIVPTVIKTIPHSTEYIEDETVETGNSVVKQQGMDGAVVDTFFILRNNQNIIKNYKLHTTTYSPLTEIIAVAPGNKP
ncbi:MAG TPA: VanW family protein [Clostridia bacterium]